MKHPMRPGPAGCRPFFIRHAVCQHRVEVEVWPSQAEVYFRDERYVDPVNTRVHFDAVVYNAPSNRVTWQVVNPGGGPGVGTIDAAGLYIAPEKNALPYGFTEIIVATAVDDPFRKAYAQVAVIGKGPAPKPVPKLEIFPRRATIYYPEGDHNTHIDSSNTRQFFRAHIYHTDLDEVEWLEDGVLTSPLWHDDWYLFTLTGSGAPKTVEITARLKDDWNVRDDAIVMVLNYFWPGIV